MAGFTKFGAAWLASSVECWQRSLNVERKYLRQGWLRMASASRGAGLPDGVPETVATCCVNYARELAFIPVLAAQRFGLELYAAVDDADNPFDDLVYGTASYEIQGKAVMLPARIGDAAQGTALYSVPLLAVQALLDSKGGAFRAFQFGQNRTLLNLFIVDYRQSDLGTYSELGVAVFVTPKDVPMTLPGMLMVALPVNQEFSRDAGREIWGYRKSLAKNMTFVYGDGTASCSLNTPEAGALSITFPRGGTASSTAIPFLNYTVRDDRMHSTVFLRSGDGERIAAGGAVEVRLGDPTGRNCLCSILGEGEGGCICRILGEWGLPKAPLIHAWTEHMSGALGIPIPVPTA